jgi:hypothetical protein
MRRMRGLSLACHVERLIGLAGLAQKADALAPELRGETEPLRGIGWQTKGTPGWIAKTQTLDCFIKINNWKRRPNLGYASKLFWFQPKPGNRLAKHYDIFAQPRHS